MGFLYDIVRSVNEFWSKSQAQTSTPTEQRGNNITTVDLTEDLKVNYALTHGIYHNTYPGLKLAGFGFNAINVPVSFMGYPVVTAEGNDQAQEQLDSIIEKFTTKMKDIHTQSHREGTIWVWPKFSARKGLEWEFIRDDSIYKIVRDVDTKELISIEVRENINFNTQADDTANWVERRRIYTRTRVTTTYNSGIVPPGLANKVSRNPSGALPVPFPNNSAGNEIRGHSDYERIVSDLKDYHDISLAESTILAQFRTKLIQTVKDFQNWKRNNGFKNTADPDGGGVSILTLNIQDIDFIVNMEGEKTELLEPSRATAAYQTKLKQIFRKIVELSGIPEIAWGLKTTGNLASVEENMAILMRYVADKQEQKIEPYTELFTYSLVLLQIAGVISSVPEITVSWDRLENLTAKTKAEIFKNITDALSTIIDKGIWSKKTLYKYLSENFPGLIEDTFEEFEDGITNMTGHAARARASLVDQITSQGGNSENEGEL